MDPFSGIALLAGAAQAVGSVMQGQQRAETARANEARAEWNAGQSMVDAEASAAAIAQDNRRRFAAARVALGSNGLDASSGSSLDYLAEMAASGAINEQLARFKGQSQAAAYRAQASAFDTEANQAPIAGTIGAVTSLLDTGSRFYFASKGQSLRAGGT